jgi:hypothetical protein
MSSNEVPGAFSAWQKIKKIANRMASTHEDKIYVVQDYSKGDLRRDLLATIPDAYKDDLYFDPNGRYPLKDLLGKHD